MDTGSSNSATMLERRGGTPQEGWALPPVPFPVGRQKGGPFFPALYPFQCAPRKFFNLEVQNREEDCEERMGCGRQRGQGPD